MSPLQKVVLGAAVLTVVAGVLILGRTASSPSMSALYTDLQPSDASAVVDALAAKRVTYNLTDAGHTVLVPTSQVYDLRVALAGAGLPSSNQGYSLLDKEGITASDFRQQIDYQRALEGELDKTLGAMQGIRSASVHLALPQASVFVDTPTNPTASVLLVASSPAGISSDAVDAVVHLVASSVKNLKPDDVTVIGSDGAVLSTTGANGGSTSGLTGTNKAVNAYEQRVGSELTSLLSRTTGAGKVAVSVTADLDLDQVQSTSEKFGPTDNTVGTYVVSEQTKHEIYGNGTSASGTGTLGADGATVSSTTIASQKSNGATSSTVAGGQAATGYGSTSDDRTFAIDRTVEQTTRAPGKIQKLHVAVLLDDKAVTADQAKAIEALVTTAAGIDSSRGDSVTVSRLPFDTSAQTEAASIAAADSSAKANERLLQMIRTLAVVLVVIIALLLAYRSARRARRVTATPINIGEIGMTRRNDLLATELAPMTNDLMLAGAVDRHEDTMGEIATIADRRPEDVANVLRSWLAESQAGR